MKNYMLSLCTGTLWLLTSCSPRITTEIFKTYPPTVADSVVLFEPGDSLPSASEPIGTVSVTDRGTTTRCQYDYVVQLAKQETAKAGGNGLEINTHITPSIWKGSCHQISATMLRIGTAEDGEDILIPYASARADGVTRGKLRHPTLTPPRHTFSLGFGPALFSSRLVTPTGTYKSKTTLQWQAEYQYVFSSGLGFGLKYLGSSTSLGTETLSEMLLMPQFVVRNRFHRQWVGKVDLGIGYGRYQDSIQKQHGLASMASMGIEHLLSDHIGVGAEVSAQTCRLKKPDGFQLEKNEWYGIQKIALLVGLRYYL